jgi:ABC-type branched-subunit amino acid transport system ATPase component
MLTIDGLEVGYGASRVLFGLSREAPAGQVVSLIGRNGMGKSTTVRTVIGMLKITRRPCAVRWPRSVGPSAECDRAPRAHAR